MKPSVGRCSVVGQHVIGSAESSWVCVNTISVFVLNFRQESTIPFGITLHKEQGGVQNCYTDQALACCGNEQKRGYKVEHFLEKIQRLSQTCKHGEKPYDQVKDKIKSHIKHI